MKMECIRQRLLSVTTRISSVPPLLNPLGAGVEHMQPLSQRFSKVSRFYCKALLPNIAVKPIRLRRPAYFVR